MLTGWPMATSTDNGARCVRLGRGARKKVAGLTLEVVRLFGHIAGDLLQILATAPVPAARRC